MCSCEEQSFQTHHVNSLAVTVYDLFCVTDLLKYSVLYCKKKYIKCSYLLHNYFRR